MDIKDEKLRAVSSAKVHHFSFCYRRHSRWGSPLDNRIGLDLEQFQFQGKSQLLAFKSRSRKTKALTQTLPIFNRTKRTGESVKMDAF